MSDPTEKIVDFHVDTGPDAAWEALLCEIPSALSQCTDPLTSLSEETEGGEVDVQELVEDLYEGEDR